MWVVKETFVERLPTGDGEDDDYAGGDLDLLYVEGEEGGDGEAVVVEAEEGGVGLQLLEEDGEDVEEDTPGLQVDLQKKSLHVLEEGFLGWIFLFPGVLQDPLKGRRIRAAAVQADHVGVHQVRDSPMEKNNLNVICYKINCCPD